jgi:hypothetical protein
MLVCLGCGPAKPNVDAAAESKKLSEDPEYAKKMQEKMGGGTPGATPSK